MIAAIMQPTYLPWMGYFDLIDSVDTFVFLDDVQVIKRSWGVRNRIAGQGDGLFLTVPLSGHKHGEGSPFTTTGIDYGQNWTKSHLSSIRHTYSKAPHFEEVFAKLEAILSIEHASIGSLNQAFIIDTASSMGTDTRFLCASELEEVSGRKDDRLLSICRTIGADRYLSALGSADYIEQSAPGGAFGGSGIDLVYHNFIHPQYVQHSDDFTSHLSIVDLLMNCGYDEGREIIRSGRQMPLSSAQVREASQ